MAPTPGLPQLPPGSVHLIHSFHIFNPCLYPPGDISHAHPLRHTQPRLFTSHSVPLRLTSTPVPRLPHTPHFMEASHTPSTPNSMLQTRASASETNRNHSLLLVCSGLPCSSHSLSLSSLSSSSLSRYLCFTLSLVYFTDVHTGIVPRSWSNRKQSSIPSVVAGYGNERYGAESRAKREGETEGEGKERRLRRKDDTQVTLCFLLSFHIQMHWLVGYSNMVS